MEIIPKSIILSQDDIIEAIANFLDGQGHEESFLISLKVEKNDGECGGAYFVTARAEVDE